VGRRNRSAGDAAVLVASPGRGLEPDHSVERRALDGDQFFFGGRSLGHGGRK
jgi:hypothetical protein